MKKLLIIDLSVAYGGQQKYVYDVAQTLTSHFSLFFMVGEEKLYNILNKFGTCCFIDNISYHHFFQLARFINDYIKKNDIEIIIFNGNRALYLSWLVVDVCKLSIKHLPFDAIPLRKRGIAVVYSYFCYYFIDKIICVAEYAQKELVLFRKKTQTIHNGIDINFFTPKINKYPIPKIIISCIARIERHKGQKELLYVIKKIVLKHKNIEVRIIGTGSFSFTIEQMIGKLQLHEFVKMYGFSNSIKQLLEETDIFVLPSSSELFPLSILEAMATSIPVISTKVAGIPEMIEHNKNGILIDPIDKDQLEIALLELIENVELRDEMGRAGRAVVEKKFNIMASAEKLKNAIDITYAEFGHKSL